MKYTVCCAITTAEDSQDGVEWRVDIDHYDELSARLQGGGPMAKGWVELRSVHDPEATLLIRMENICSIFRCTEAWCIAKESEDQVNKLMGDDT